MIFMWHIPPPPPPPPKCWEACGAGWEKKKKRQPNAGTGACGYYSKTYKDKAVIMVDDIHVGDVWGAVYKNHIGRCFLHLCV